MLKLRPTLTSESRIGEVFANAAPGLIFSVSRIEIRCADCGDELRREIEDHSWREVRLLEPSVSTSLTKVVEPWNARGPWNREFAAAQLDIDPGVIIEGRTNRGRSRYRAAEGRVKADATERRGKIEIGRKNSTSPEPNPSASFPVGNEIVVPKVNALLWFLCYQSKLFMLSETSPIPVVSGRNFSSRVKRKRRADAEAPVRRILSPKNW